MCPAARMHRNSPDNRYVPTCNRYAFAPVRRFLRRSAAGMMWAVRTVTVGADAHIGPHTALSNVASCGTHSPRCACGMTVGTARRHTQVPPYISGRTAHMVRRAGPMCPAARMHRNPSDNRYVPTCRAGACPRRRYGVSYLPGALDEPPHPAPGGSAGPWLLPWQQPGIPPSADGGWDDWGISPAAAGGDFAPCEARPGALPLDSAIWVARRHGGKGPASTADTRVVGSPHRKKIE